MESRNKSLYPLLVIAAIAVTLFSALGIAMMMGYLPSANSANSANSASSADKPVASQPAFVQRRPFSREAELAPGNPQKPTAACATCGVVESIRIVEHRGSGSGVGAVAGGLAGALVGNQFGRGDGRTVMTLLGGAGGAYAGNEIEKSTKRSSSYEVRVRLDKGGISTTHMASSPSFAVGDKVRLVNGTVVPQT